MLETKFDYDTALGLVGRDIKVTIVGEDFGSNAENSPLSEAEIPGSQSLPDPEPKPIVLRTFSGRLNMVSPNHNQVAITDSKSGMKFYPTEDIVFFEEMIESPESMT
jgi:hypothetical protein